MTFWFICSKEIKGLSVTGGKRGWRPVWECRTFTGTQEADFSIFRQGHDLVAKQTEGIVCHGAEVAPLCGSRY